MSNRLILEICVESLEQAIAAERAGADRIELCADLSSGGITPSTTLMRQVRAELRCPIHVLIRPRPGNFCYDATELEIMRVQVRAAKDMGMDGVVFGVLGQKAEVDIERTQALLELAQPLPVTFHRAFDACPNFEAALEDVIQTGATRILTSAGHARATDALPTLARLVERAKERIVIMPCGRIRADNVLQVLQTTHAAEIHSSAGSSNPSNGTALPGEGQARPLERFEQEVARMASQLREASGLQHDTMRGSHAVSGVLPPEKR